MFSGVMERIIPGSGINVLGALSNSKSSNKQQSLYEECVSVTKTMTSHPAHLCCIKIDKEVNDSAAEKQSHKQNITQLAHLSKTSIANYQPSKI